MMMRPKSGLVVTTSTLIFLFRRLIMSMTIMQTNMYKTEKRAATKIWAPLSVPHPASVMERRV